MQVVVAVRKALAMHVADVDISALATGPFGAVCPGDPIIHVVQPREDPGLHECHGCLGCTWFPLQGNKGCAAVRFRLGEATLCFVCVHLPAHDHKASQRDADMRYIAQGLRFPAVPEAVLASHECVV
jgi:hypothetical protein